ncbi:MAG TPA: Spy/CpxP family protein refolding chaperone [Planctomycetota bacterium]|nr:Spy/CpxP family protein refolding chaperone [Planctomycetota bacterium]
MRTITRLALALLLVAPAAAAQSAHPARGHARVGRLARKLDLSDAQREQIRGRVASHADELARLRAAVADARAELRHVLDTSPADAAAVRAASQHLQAARTERTVARGARRADVRAALTPDQQTRAQQLRDEHRAQRASRKAARAERRAERLERKAAGGHAPR